MLAETSRTWGDGALVDICSHRAAAEEPGMQEAGAGSSGPAPARQWRERSSRPCSSIDVRHILPTIGVTTLILHRKGRPGRSG